MKAFSVPGLALAIVKDGKIIVAKGDRKSDQVDAEKLARFAQLDPKILRPLGGFLHGRRPLQLWE
jgi:hypothetical protein